MSNPVSVGDDLVARLRSRKGEAITRVERLMDEAASQLAAVTAERDEWQRLATEDVEALQAIGDDFGIRAGENRVSGVRRILTEQQFQLKAAREALTDIAKQWPDSSAAKTARAALNPKATS